jgi:hypothetical protein
MPQDKLKAIARAELIPILRVQVTGTSSADLSPKLNLKWGKSVSESVGEIEDITRNRHS